MATTSCGGSSNIIFILEDLSFLSLWEASSGLRGCATEASCPQIKNIVVVVVGGQKKLQKEIDRSWRRRRLGRAAGWQKSKKREEGKEPP